MMRVSAFHYVVHCLPFLMMAMLGHVSPVALMKYSHDPVEKKSPFVQQEYLQSTVQAPTIEEARNIRSHLVHEVVKEVESAGLVSARAQSSGESPSIYSESILYSCIVLVQLYTKKSSYLCWRYYILAQRVDTGTNVMVTTLTLALVFFLPSAHATQPLDFWMLPGQSFRKWPSNVSWHITTWKSQCVVKQDPYVNREYKG